MLQIRTGSGAFPLRFPRGYRHITDELLAAEFLEQMRWGSTPSCLCCSSKEVKKVIDAKTGERDKHLYWRCRGCYKRFSVRDGTVMKGTRVPISQWLRVLYLLNSKGTITPAEIHEFCHLSFTTSSYIVKRISCGIFKAGEAWRTGAIAISKS